MGFRQRVNYRFKSLISSFDNSPTALSEGIFLNSRQRTRFASGGKIHFISSRFWRVSLNSTEIPSGANRRLPAAESAQNFVYQYVWEHDSTRYIARADNGSGTTKPLTEIQCQLSVGCGFTLHDYHCENQFVNRCRCVSIIPDIGVRSRNRTHDIDRVQDNLSDCAAYFAFSLASKSCSSSVLR
ncbi:MAG: hypothetical protein CM15mP119_1560 [Alphaproteobacteria bacterium]|nr:MAG: hypothetical protein CM15mP119_1560 [Alphaproteobacteria bacterium]